MVPYRGAYSAAFGRSRLSVNPRCDDGNGNIVHTKRIPFTDFSLPTLSLSVANKTLILPGEH